MAARITHRRTCIAASLLLFAGGCLAPEFTDAPIDNQPPLPYLRAPVIAPVGVPITFEASESYDPDGDPIYFIWTFNGGESLRSADNVTHYTFTNPGLYTVSVLVVDIHNADAMAKQDVSVVAEYREPPDYCIHGRPSTCPVGDECDHGVCYNLYGGLE